MHKDHYKSPPLIIRDASGIIKKVGQLEFQADRKYKDERELRAVALFQTAIFYETGQRTYLKMGQDPPDVEGVVLEPTEKGNVKHVLSIEVTEVTPKSSKDIFDIIKAKLTTPYPDYYIILCYVWGGEHLIIPQEIIDKLHPLFNGREVWIMGQPSSREITVIRLSPGFNRIDCDYVEAANSWGDSPHYISTSRGR